MTRPGKVNLPVLVTSLVPISAKVLIMPDTLDALISCSSAIAFAIAPLVMTLIGPFIAFAFMGAI